MAELKDRMMEIAPTSYLRVDGASIVDGSGMPVRWEACTRRIGLELTLRLELVKS